MPLVGGGGAPNVSGGANPSGTGSGLNYVGNHVYAMSGTVAADDNNRTLLDFTTGGSSYIVAELQIGSDSGSGDDFRYSVLFNNLSIMEIYAQRTDQGFPNFGIPFRFIIPAETRVTIKANNITTGTNRDTYATLVGRVYA